MSRARAADQSLLVYRKTPGVSSEKERTMAHLKREGLCPGPVSVWHAQLHACRRAQRACWRAGPRACDSGTGAPTRPLALSPFWKRRSPPPPSINQVGRQHSRAIPAVVHFQMRAHVAWRCRRWARLAVARPGGWGGGRQSWNKASINTAQTRIPPHSHSWGAHQPSGYVSLQSPRAAMRASVDGCLAFWRTPKHTPQAPPNSAARLHTHVPHGAVQLPAAPSPARAPCAGQTRLRSCGAIEMRKSPSAIPFTAIRRRPGIHRQSYAAERPCSHKLVISDHSLDMSLVQCVLMWA